MVGTFSLLLLYQLAGELLVRAFGWPFPGPVIGMSLLFITFLMRGTVSHELRSGTGTLLQHLSLLFVPAGAGVMLHLQRIADEWLPIAVALFGSTFIGLAVTAFVIRVLAGDSDKEPS